MRRIKMMAAIIWTASLSSVVAQDAGWICTQPAVFPGTGSDIVRYWVEGDKLFISDKYDAIAQRYGSPQNRWVVIVNNAQGLVAVAADAGFQYDQVYVWADMIRINKATGELHKSSSRMEDKTDNSIAGRCIKG